MDDRASTPRRDRLDRPAVLAAAVDLLRTEGPEAVSVRRVGDRAGASAQVVYTLFGGKPGLADALYVEGFRRLAAALAEVDAPADPVEQLVGLLLAYRRAALAEPAFYALMFARAIPGFAASPASRETARQTFGTLVAAVRAGRDAGLLHTADPEETARDLWGLAHGLVALEQAGLYPPDRSAGHYERAARVMLAGYRRPPAA